MKDLCLSFLGSWILYQGNVSAVAMAPKQSPRNLPKSSRRSGNFAPRRSFARARASKEKVSAIDRMLRNQRSQASFTRNLKLVVNIICLIGIIGLIIYTVFMAQKPDDQTTPVFETPEELRR